MNSMRTASLFVVVLIASGRPTVASGDVFRLDQQIGFASFTSNDGCLFTDVTVVATDAVVQMQFPPRAGASDSTCFVSISQVDTCVEGGPTQEILVEALGVGLADRDFEVSPKLERATLDCTITDGHVRQGGVRRVIRFDA
jgi:hypothetical protein